MLVIIRYPLFKIPDRLVSTFLVTLLLSWSYSGFSSDVEAFWQTEVQTIYAAEAEVTFQHGFGVTVELSGDFAFVSSAGEARVYIYSKNINGIWELLKFIEPFGNLGTTSKGALRYSWHIESDGDTLLVSAQGFRDSSINAGSGAIYVYQRDLGGPNNWGGNKLLLPSDAVNFDGAIAIDTDTIVVGTGGGAYVYSRDLGGANNWGEQKKIEHPDPQPSALFGRRVDISGTRIVVSDIGYNDGTILNAGSVFLFEKDEGGLNNWGNTHQFLAPTNIPQNMFGKQISIDQDIVVVVARNTDEKGAVYLFEAMPSEPVAWELKAVLNSNHPEFPRSLFLTVIEFEAGSLILIARPRLIDEPTQVIGYTFVDDDESRFEKNTQYLNCIDLPQSMDEGYSLSLENGALMVGQAFLNNTTIFGVTPGARVNGAVRFYDTPDQKNLCLNKQPMCFLIKSARGGSSSICL